MIHGFCFFYFENDIILYIKELEIMTTSKEYRDYILEQLSELEPIYCRPMMGEYLLYYKDILFGGFMMRGFSLKMLIQIKFIIFL